MLLFLLLALVISLVPYPTEADIHVLGSPVSEVSYRAAVTVEFVEKNGKLSASVKTSVLIEDTDGNGIPLDQIVIPASDHADFKFSILKFNKNEEEYYSIDEYYEELEYDDVFISGGHRYVIPNPLAHEHTESISYTYSLEYDDPVYLPSFYVPNTYGKTGYQIEVVTPTGYSAEIDEVKFGEVSLGQSTDAKRKETVLTGSYTNLEYRYDEYLDWTSNYHAALRIKLTKDGQTMLKDTPNTFTSWYLDQLIVRPFDDTIIEAMESVDADRRDLALLSMFVTDPSYEYLRERVRRDNSNLRGRKLDAKVKESLEEMVNAYVRVWEIGREIAALPEDQQMKAAYEWAQSLRYVADHSGGHSIFPRDPIEIIETRYGDCKDRATMLSLFLTLSGYDNHLVLVSTEDQYMFSGVVLGQFDHMLLAVETDDGLMYLDPTARYSPFGFVPNYLTGRRAFHLDRAEPRWETIPAQSEPSLVVEITGSVEDPASMDARVTFSSGQLAAVKRTITRATSQLEIENTISNLVNSQLFLISLEDFRLVTDAESTIIFEASADASDYVLTSNASAYIPRLPVVVSSNSINRWRSNPGTIYEPFLVRTRLVLNLSAEGYSHEVSDVNITEEGIGNFTAISASDSDSRYTFDYTYALERLHLSSDEEASYLDFVSRVAENRNQVFTLTRTPADESTDE